MEVYLLKSYSTLQVGFELATHKGFLYIPILILIMVTSAHPFLLIPSICGTVFSKFLVHYARTPVPVRKNFPFTLSLSFVVLTQTGKWLTKCIHIANYFWFTYSSCMTSTEESRTLVHNVIPSSSCTFSKYDYLRSAPKSDNPKDSFRASDFVLKVIFPWN